MSTTDSEEVGVELILTPRQRRNPILLPEDPSDEDLARDWSLSAADMREVVKCRGDDNRCRFAIHLCVLPKYGRFLIGHDVVRGRILAHIQQRIGITDPKAFLMASDRDATETEYQERIRVYLGWRPFDAGAIEGLDRWLSSQADEDWIPLALYRRAEQELRRLRVVLPAPSTLERIIAGFVARVEVHAFERIESLLPHGMGEVLDELLAIPEGETSSGLARLKEGPKNPNTKGLNSCLTRYRTLVDVGVHRVDLVGVPASMVAHLAKMADRYDVWSLKRFATAKRHALVACYLAEALKSVLDHAVEMHDQFLIALDRTARSAHEKKQRELRPRLKEGTDRLLGLADAVLDPQLPPAMTVVELRQEVGEPSIDEARRVYRDFKHLEERGYLDQVASRYSTLRRYLPSFLALPFQAEAGFAHLVAAIAVVKALDADEIDELPVDAPTAFLPPTWRPFFEREDGTLDRHLWETALAFAVRDALRAGGLYLPQSRHHVSFANLLYDERQWAEVRERSPLPMEPLLAELSTRLDTTVREAERGIGQNPFVSIEADRIHLKQPDALPVPPNVKNLKRVLATRLPRVRIEDLLAEVDSWCGFTREFQPLGGHEPRSENLYGALLAALVAHGTNLGIATMGTNAPGLTVDMLRHVSKWFLREETIRAANAVIVNYHHALPIASVWGEGKLSSSDGQRFGVRASTLLASFYPRYFGYYDRAVSVYTHTSDQHSVYSTQVISCSVREALYVLDGILTNNTVLGIKEHTTDTHGYTEILFALCHLLGIRFMPRIKNLADQQLYKLDRASHYGPLDGLFRGPVELDLVREQWDLILRVKASLLDRVTPAHVVMQRLQSAPRSDRLAKALTSMGRVLKTIYIMEYIHDANLRGRVQLQLNRGESRHSLAKRLFFAEQGEFRKGDFAEVMNKASCLSLLSNAVLVWNTVKIGEIVEAVRAAGQTVLDQDLARISPLLREHVTPSGTYHFRLSNPGVDLAYNTLP